MSIDTNTAGNLDLLLASNTLNYTEYERYKAFQRRAENDLMTKNKSILSQVKHVQWLPLFDMVTQNQEYLNQVKIDVVAMRG